MGLADTGSVKECGRQAVHQGAVRSRLRTLAAVVQTSWSWQNIIWLNLRTLGQCVARAQQRRQLGLSGAQWDAQHVQLGLSKGCRDKNMLSRASNCMTPLEDNGIEKTGVISTRLPTACKAVGGQRDVQQARLGICVLKHLRLDLLPPQRGQRMDLGRARSTVHQQGLLNRRRRRAKGGREGGVGGIRGAKMPA